MNNVQNSFYQPQYFQDLNREHHAQAPKAQAPIQDPEAATILYDADDCVICTDEFDSENPKFGIQCGHVFHKTCVKNWANHSANPGCPLCERSISYLKPKPQPEAPVQPKQPAQPKQPVQPRQTPQPTTRATQQGDKCGVCDEAVGPKVLDTVVTKCHHLFHKDCLNVWLDSVDHKVCRTCHKSVQERDIKLLTPPRPQEPKPSTFGDTLWWGAGMGYSVVSTGVWGLGKIVEGLASGTSYLLSLRNIRRPLTSTEQLAVSAHEKLNKLYATRADKLERMFNEHLGQIDLSIGMARSVYEPSLHVPFEKALKQLVEDVNDQFVFCQNGINNFYDEGLNVFAQALAWIPNKHNFNKGVYQFDPFIEVVKLSGKESDEFSATKQAIGKAYASHMVNLKAELKKQFEHVSKELDKIAQMDPAEELAARRAANRLVKQLQTELNWLETGSDISKEFLSKFNKSVRFAR